MKKIAIQEIADGMVLGKPLMGGDGKILMAAGAELKESMADRLKSWGVLFAYIQENGEEGDADSLEEKIGQVDELARRFKDVLTNPKMAKIHAAIKAHITGTSK